MASLDEARKLAERMVREMTPYCERVEIAGSIRREKPEVKDIEICVIPKWEERPGSDLFGTPEKFNLLHEWADKQMFVRWIKPGVPDVQPWWVKPDGKYWRGIFPNGIKLDLFIAAPENFGAIYLIRTGSADFSEGVVTHAKRIGKRCQSGYFTVDGEPVPTPTEESVFELLNLRYVEPSKRTGPEALCR